jgi:hypothetical protein
MSFKAKIAAAAATFALAGGGLGMLGTLSASAATPRCGPHCQDLYTQKFGPRYLLATVQGMAAANQEVILRKASNRHPTEDFVIKDLGSVGSFYGHHGRLITPQFDTSYGSLSAYEFQYAPHGVNSNLCLGTSPGQVAQAGFQVRLEPCGKHRNSVWAIFTGRFVRDHTTFGYDVLISAATDSLSDPLVLNYPAGRPTDRPSPGLNVQPLRAHANGTIFNTEQWAYRNGPVK